MCVYFVAMMCAGRFGLGWAYDCFLVCMSYIHAFSCIHNLISLYSYILMCLVFFSLCVCLSLSPSFFRLVASWHLNENLFHPKILFVLGHPLLPLIPLILLFGSVMRRLIRTSLDEAFIWNGKSSYQIFPILTYPLSSTIGVGSHCVASQSFFPS